MSEQPVVTTKQGQLRGRTDFDHDGSRYYSFFGIPYAKPPLGDLRFKAPQPPEQWEGIRDATEEGDECYSHHMVFRTPVGSENCLILNVFTSELPQSQRNPKPVMFWIHGGGFTQGSSKTEAYSPDFLICEDVVIVTNNYRLGALGFLSFEDPALGVPGNAGLKDMVMALKWVQANIAAFNGDPNNVTIFGESAGGASVHLLMLSPMAKNLFHKAIAQSGSALNIWVPGQKGGRELAKHLGYTGNDDREILKVLTEASKEDLLNAQNKCNDPTHASDVRPLGPVVEKFNAYEESFLPDEAINIILSGNYNKVPLMMGYNNREGFLFEIMEQRAKFSHKIINFEHAVPYTMKLPQGSPASKDIARRIKEFYFGVEPQDTKDNLESYYKLQTDNFFYRGIYSAIKNHLETSTTPIYFYRFSFEGKLNIYKNFTNITQKGVSHADELGYLFKMAIIPEIRVGSPEDLTIRRMAKLWTNFARRGDPNPIKPESLIQVVWPPCERDNLKYLEIEENLSVGSNPDLERMKFWDDILSVNPATSKL